jgi:hypothetical protein
MAIRKTIEVLNAMQADGVIGRYAIAGAVAAYNYVEPAVTQDLDILVAFENTPASGLINLEPLFSYLSKKGYAHVEKEGVIVGDWPVQFLPVANDLHQEALAQAVEIELGAGTGDTVAVWLLRPEHLVAIALSVGRPKDLIRISQFLDEEAVEIAALCRVLSGHNLRFAWQTFCAKMGIKDPCDPSPRR